MNLLGTSRSLVSKIAREELLVGRCTQSQTVDGHEGRFRSREEGGRHEQKQ